jgi:hypothetical protein
MTNLWIFFLIMYIGGQILSFGVEGSAGIATTTLNEDLLATDSASVDVLTTAGFTPEGVIIIRDEIIRYDGLTGTSFTITQRGARATQPADHSIGSRVYNESTGLINQVIGFHILETFADDGFFKGLTRTIVALPQMLKNVISKLVMWDFSYLNTGGGVYIKYFFYAISGGLIITAIVTFVFRAK